MRVSTKRWMVSLTEEQYEWVGMTSKGADLKGSEVLRAAVDMAMANPSFGKTLANQRLKTKLQDINDAQARLEEERQAVTQQLKGERVPA